jgi:hypothetical protein
VAFGGHEVAVHGVVEVDAYATVEVHGGVGHPVARVGRPQGLYLATCAGSRRLLISVTELAFDPL